MTISSRFGIDFYLSEDEIYLDSATAGKVPIKSIKLVEEFYKDHGGGIGRGTHKTALQASRFIENQRDKIAKIFSVDNNQLSFFPSREIAVLNALFSLNIPKNQKIVTSILEDHSVLAPAIRYCEINKTELNYLNIPDEENIAEAILKQIDPNTKAVFLSALTLGMGVKRDWESISKICKENEIKFILDISYAIGHEKFSFNENIADIIISSGYNGALGPQGTAFQILSKEMLDKTMPLLVGGGSVISLEKQKFKLASGSGKFEPGALNAGAFAGLANSLQLLSDVGFENIRKHETKLRELLTKGLKDITNIEIVQHENIIYGPILSFMSELVDAHDIAIILEDLSTIMVRSGALCSHLFMDEIKQDSLVQVSTHLYNTEEEIKVFTETLGSIMNEIK